MQRNIAIASSPLLTRNGGSFLVVPQAVAAAIAALKPQISKPLLTCWMGDSSVADARRVFSEATIPTFRTPEAAVDAFSNIASFYQNQLLLQQTPPPLSELTQPDVEGARMLKMDDRIGSLTPGKQAEPVLIDATQLNMHPVHDPVAAVVMQTSLANIDSVMIAGQWKKRQGQLLGVDLAPQLSALRASGHKITRAMGL